MSRRSAIVSAKIGRLRDGQPARVVDLFSGCGGMSLGFQQAGCEIVAGIEKEGVRATTHARNFHGHLGPELEALHGRSTDITVANPLDTLRELCGGKESAIDIVVGGPPCQAYARVGRAKLREIGKHPEAHLQDARGQLYAAYVAWVAALQPVAVVMENVPDILSFGGVNVGELVAESLEGLGYEVRYTLLNAAHFGVPQTRERFFLVGIHRDVHRVPSFPAPTHGLVLPVGYRGTRGHASRWSKATAADRPVHAVLLEEPSRGLPAVGCEAALGDLPVVTEAAKTGQGRKKRDLEAVLPYASRPANDYQRQMRFWPDYESWDAVSAHVIRSLPRDYETFRQMEEGDDYPAAHRTAEAIFDRAVRRARRRGEDVEEGSAAWENMRKAIVPPYDPNKFPNKWRKLERAFPSRTLMAHLSHDSYSHIHYDSEQARTISVREAARLQSFPDGFEFCGAMNAAFGQIGNAVPPMLASVVATSLLEALRDGN